MDALAESIIPERLAEILSDPQALRDPETRETVTQIVAAYEAVQGPLPPPSMLAEYETILPGISHRMFRQVELQSDHRRSLENRAVDASIKRSSRGQWFALSIALAALALGAFLIYVDKPLAGFGVLLSGIAPIVGAFLYSQHRQRKELQTKWESSEPGASGADPDSDSVEEQRLTIAAQHRERQREGGS